jgi:hypothetical protein
LRSWRPRTASDPVAVSPTQLVTVDFVYLSQIGTYVQPMRSYRSDCAFQLKSRTPSELHNEHFLHNRRRGRSNRSCRVLGIAPLNKELDTTKRALFNVLNTWLEAARFRASWRYEWCGWHQVGPLATTEAWQLEKVSACEEAQVAIVSALATERARPTRSTRSPLRLDLKRSPRCATTGRAKSLEKRNRSFKLTRDLRLFHHLSLRIHNAHTRKFQ